MEKVEGRGAALTENATATCEPESVEESSMSESTEAPESSKSESQVVKKGATWSFTFLRPDSAQMPYVEELIPPASVFEKTAAEHLINPPEFPKLDRPKPDRSKRDRSKAESY